MKFCKNTTTELFFSSVADISDAIWNELGCTDNIYFHPNYLLALEKNNQQITFSYIVLTNAKQQPIAFASIQIVELPADVLENTLNKTFYEVQCFGRKLGIFPKLKPIKILVCGNVFVSGEHGIFIKQGQDKQKVLKDLAKAITQMVNSNKSLAKNISVFLLKDFIKESLTITNGLRDLNYYSFNVEPNMVLTVSKNWQTFDDYLNAMKTKYRVKAKRALALSSNLVIKNTTLQNIQTHLPEMTRLYKKVSAKADFNLGDFNLETYTALKEKLGDSYFLHTYWLDEKIVGFMSGMITMNALDAHFVGIDYALNKERAIYQRMLYDYVAMAIEKNLSAINFGRTASEIKSSIGATPQDLTCYVRHKKSITNRFLKPFLKYIAPTPFRQKMPFKIKKKLT